MNVNSPVQVPESWSYKAQSLLKTDVYLENNGLVVYEDGFIFFVKVTLHPFWSPWPHILFKLMYIAPAVTILLVGIYSKC